MNASQQHITDRLDEHEARWFVLRTGHRKEKMAASQLMRDGIDYFLPLQQVKKHYLRKVVVRKICLLPSYIFAKVTRADAAAIYANPWANFLKVGKERLDVPEAEIEVLRRIVGEKSMDLEWELVENQAWTNGQEIELIGGPLTGTKGIYLQQKNKGQLLISLGLLPLGTGLRTTVPEAWIRPLGGRVKGAA